MSKKPVSKDPATSKILNAPNTVEILTTAPLPYLLIPVKKIRVEKVSLSVCKI